MKKQFVRDFPVGSMVGFDHDGFLHSGKVIKHLDEDTSLVRSVDGQKWEVYQIEMFKL